MATLQDNGFKDFTMTFRDATGMILDEKTISPSTKNYNIVLGGREVELKFNGEPIAKFNTLKEGSDE